MTEGTFNTFTPADLNRLQSRAKQFIRQKALESEFTQQAEEQAFELLSIYNSLANVHGWEVEIQGYSKDIFSNKHANQLIDSASEWPFLLILF